MSGFPLRTSFHRIALSTKCTKEHKDASSAFVHFMSFVDSLGCVNRPHYEEEVYSRSVLAAIIKSFRCRPLILCVHQVTVTRPHSVSSAG